MKYLGNVKVTLLKEKQKHKKLFSPLSESEYADLRESIREAGILNDLIVEKRRGRVHHSFRASPQGCCAGDRHGRGPLLPRRNARRNT